MKLQFSASLLRQCVFLAGPTATGKTDVTVALCERLPSLEVISLDSMCIYRGMDIGTAKPSIELQQRIPHHLIDVCDPNCEYSVADYVGAAINIVEDIVQRGGRPVFVGGTGLYLRSALRGVFMGPPADWDIRNRLQKLADEAAQRGDHYWLMLQLEKVDPDSALRLHPNDHRRLIRAIEVYELTGQPLSQQQKQDALPNDERPPHVYWLSPPRDWLHDRINRRVDVMLADGLVDEVRRLMRLDPPISHTAAQGLGYKEVIDAMHGDPDAELSPTATTTMVDQIQTRTRQFAKRQCTWFRNLEECHEVELTGTESADDIATRLAERIG